MKKDLIQFIILWALLPLAVLLIVWMITDNLRTSAGTALMTLILVFILYFIWNIMEPYIPAKKSKIYKNSEKGDLLVPIRCSKYIVERCPFVVGVGNTCLASICRGDEVLLPIPSGTDDVYIQCGNSEKFILRMTSNEDTMVHIWVDYDGLANIKAVCMNKADVFDEREIERVYRQRINDVRKTIYMVIGGIVIFISLLFWI